MFRTGGQWKGGFSERAERGCTRSWGLDVFSAVNAMLVLSLIFLPHLGCNHSDFMCLPARCASFLPVDTATARHVMSETSCSIC